MSAESPFRIRDELIQRFYAKLARKPTGRLLEIGSRNRTNPDRKRGVPGSWSHEALPHGWIYEGLDILPGGHTTIVADAHKPGLTRESVDAIISLATFEHLQRPWEVVIELHHILKHGAPVLVVSHQSFPLHELPGDYWRFSPQAWSVLFNEEAGYRVLDAGVSCPARVTPLLNCDRMSGVETLPAYIFSHVLAEKL